MSDGSRIVPPSGDQSGITDTEALDQAAARGPVRLLPATYYVNELTGTAGCKFYGAGWQGGQGGALAPAGMFTRFQAGTAAKGPSMLSFPAGTGAWRIEGISFLGQDVKGRKPCTGALISLPDSPGPVGVAEFGTITWCDLTHSAGDGIYVGTRRDAVRVDNIISHYHAGAAVNLQGSDCIITRASLAYSARGYVVGPGGELARISDCDIYQNTVGGQISAPRVYVQRCSHDQQQEEAVVVDSRAAGVSLHGRFMLSSMSSPGACPHADISGSGAQGVTFEPGTVFAAQEFGDTQKVSYDILARGVAYQDYSTYAAAGYSLGHAG